MSGYIGHLTDKERENLKRDIATVVRILKKSRHTRRIICALRGPDSSDFGVYNLKISTTACIRHAVGFRDEDFTGWDILPGKLPTDDMGWQELKKMGGGQHFNSHVRQAAEALRDIFGDDII